MPAAALESTMIQSRRFFGRGVRHASVTGTITSIAMINRIAAKLTVASPPYVKGFVNQTSAPFDRLVLTKEAETWLAQLDLAATKYFNLPMLSDEARIWMRVDKPWCP